MTQTEPNERVAIFPVTRLKPLDSNKKLWLWSLVNHVTCKGFLSISFPFAFKMPLYTCAIKPWNIYVSAPWIWPRCKRQKNQTSAPKITHLLVDDFDILVLGQSCCVPDLAIPFSVVFLCLTRWNVLACQCDSLERISIKRILEDFHRRVRIKRQGWSRWSICLKFPRGTTQGPWEAQAESEQIIHGVFVFVLLFFYMNPF